MFRRGHNLDCFVSNFNVNIPPKATYLSIKLNVAMAGSNFWLFSPTHPCNDGFSVIVSKFHPLFKRAQTTFLWLTRFLGNDMHPVPAHSLLNCFGQLLKLRAIRRVWPFVCSTVERQLWEKKYHPITAFTSRPLFKLSASCETLEKKGGLSGCRVCLPQTRPRFNPQNLP